jgi:penicillin-binding protein 2
MRIKIAQVVLALAFLFLLLALFYNQVMQANKYQRLSEANCIRIIPQDGSRGRIFDRKSNVLVDNRLSYDVAILPKEVKDLDKVFAKLAVLLGVPFEDIESRFRKGVISTSLPVTLVNNIDRKKAIVLEELKSELQGVIIQTVPQRLYPYGRLAAHIFGYLGEIDHWRLTKLKDYGYKTKDTVGYTGIEERYDYYLRPEEGGLQVEVDNQNRIIRVLAFKPPKNGRDIQTTLDLRIQKIVEENLEGKRGAIIIIEPYNAEVLALASFPNYHPAWFYKQTTFIKKLLNDPNASLLNRGISGLYPPGSVFKVVVAAGGLQTQKINLKKNFYCQGSLKIGRGDFSCWHIHENQNLIEAIAHSCNVFFYRLGLLLGPDKLYEYAIKFGLGKLTQIDLPGEADGYIPSPLRKRLNRFQTWFDGDTANFTIGQGEVLVTPLQITRIMAAFANGGNLVRPYLVKSIDNKDITQYQKKIIPLYLEDSTLNAIKSGLKAAVDYEDGTAHILKLDSVSVAGKTGTAQVSRGNPHAWFSGYFPADRPKFVICVFLEHGGSSFNACLLTKNIIERMQQEGLL